jgi:hypothetical protein
MRAGAGVFGAGGFGGGLLERLDALHRRRRIRHGRGNRHQHRQDRGARPDGPGGIDHLQMARLRQRPIANLRIHDCTPSIVELPATGRASYPRACPRRDCSPGRIGASPRPFPLGPELAGGTGRTWAGAAAIQSQRQPALPPKPGRQTARLGGDWLDRASRRRCSKRSGAAFKNDLPRVIRPDIILTDSGPCITELDSVPGGIGLTAWLNQTYAAMPERRRPPVIGGADGMLQGFAGILTTPRRSHRHFRGSANLPAGNGLAGRAVGRAIPGARRAFHRFQGRATRSIAFLNCSICPTCPTQTRLLSWPGGEIRLTRRPSRFSRRRCSSRCCGTGTCAAFGGRNWARFLSAATLSPYTWMSIPPRCRRRAPCRN